MKHERDTPGPGQYEPAKKFGNENPKFSLYGRVKERDREISKFPGPGEYKFTAINPLGKFPFSNIHNVTNIVWGKSKENRFNYTCKKLSKNCLKFFILFKYI